MPRKKSELGGIVQINLRFREKDPEFHQLAAELSRLQQRTRNKCLLDILQSALCGQENYKPKEKAKADGHNQKKQPAQKPKHQSVNQAVPAQSVSPIKEPTHGAAESAPDPSATTPTAFEDALFLQF
jgi:hypothetical protein